LLRVAVLFMLSPAAVALPVAALVSVGLAALDAGPWHRARSVLWRMSMRFVRFVLPLAVMLVAAGLLAACHTVEGVGQDVSSAGHAVTSAASSASH
jgi:predicted small secreted protein